MRSSNELDQVVGERSLGGQTASGEDVEVLIQLGMPRPFVDNTGYECPCRIVGPSFDTVSWTAGLDSIQALQLTLVMIGALVRRLCRDAGITVHWTMPGDDLGLPAIDIN
jgi:hypothetical protein